jgi:hypothetical protein
MDADANEIIIAIALNTADRSISSSDNSGLHNYN